MLPDAIYYKREKIKIRWMGRKESQDLDCVGMFVPADNEILIYKNYYIRQSRYQSIICKGWKSQE